MKTLEGATIEHAQLGDLSKVADLIYFDGPLLSLFHNGEGENFLYHWCDCDEKANRWLVCKVSDKVLETFLKGELSLRTLLREPNEGFLYCVDLNERAEEIAAAIVSPKQLPNEYLPEANSFYKDEPVIETRQQRTTLKVAIDGHWEFYDLGNFPRLFREAYAFTSAFVGQSALKLPFLPMRDGFSSMHLFRDLENSLPQAIWPSLRGVRYASPGAILFNVDRSVTSALLRILKAARAESGAAAVSYNYLHGLVADKKLLGEDATVVEIESETSQQIGKLAVDLARDLELPHPELLLEKSPNALYAAKVILAFYRLVFDRLLEYERDERMRIPTLP